MPRVLDFLERSPFIVHFGRWRGRNRWPLAHAENVARAAVLAATADEARGEAYNVLDPERTTIEEYYRMLVDAFLPEKRGMRSVTLPLAAGRAAGAVSSLVSDALDLDRPLFDPSLYGLHSVSANLDFSGAKLEHRFAAHGVEFITKEAGIGSLARVGA